MWLLKRNNQLSAELLFSSIQDILAYINQDRNSIWCISYVPVYSPPSKDEGGNKEPAIPLVPLSRQKQEK